MIDRLLRWMAARRRGSWESFKEAHAWLQATQEDDHEARETTPAEVARGLELLGRAQFDWPARTWAAREPAVAGLAEANYAAVVVGLLSKTQQERLEELEAGDAGSVLVERSMAWEAIESVVLVGDDDRGLEQAAAHLGVPWIPDAGLHLAAGLPALGRLADRGAADYQPPPRMLTEQFTFDADQPWERVRVPSAEGFYRVRPEYGPTRFFTRLGQRTTLRSDRQAGIYLAARALGEPVLTYAEAERRLYVPAWGVPPAPHAQALVLCSGLPPRRLYDRAFPGANLYFANVPFAVARSVADSLAQTLEQRESVA